MEIIFVTVLKSRFYYYSGLVRLTDQEMIATEKKFVIVSKKGAWHITRATQGSPRGCQVAEDEGKMWIRAFFVE